MKGRVVQWSLVVRIQLYLDLKERDPLPVVRAVERLDARSFVFHRPYSYTAVRQILAESPSSRLLIDLGDWAQAAPFVETLRRQFPTASLSSDWANWTPAALAEARRIGVPTLVNVLGPADTPENLRRGGGAGFRLHPDGSPPGAPRDPGERAVPLPFGGS